MFPTEILDILYNFFYRFAEWRDTTAITLELTYIQISSKKL